MAKTPISQCRGPRLDPFLGGTKSLMLKLKIPHAATKTQHSQIKRYWVFFFFLMKKQQQQQQQTGTINILEFGEWKRHFLTNEENEAELARDSMTYSFSI